VSKKAPPLKLPAAAGALYIASVITDLANKEDDFEPPDPRLDPDWYKLSPSQKKRVLNRGDGMKWHRYLPRLAAAFVVGLTTSNDLDKISYSRAALVVRAMCAAIKYISGEGVKPPAVALRLAAEKRAEAEWNAALDLAREALDEQRRISGIKP